MRFQDMLVSYAVEKAVDEAVEYVTDLIVYDGEVFPVALGNEGDWFIATFDLANDKDFIVATIDADVE